jgi:hypothetical protein
MTWFIRRPDDGHVRTETCSLKHNKIWCVWRKVFYHFNIDFAYQLLSVCVFGEVKYSKTDFLYNYYTNVRQMENLGVQK